MQNIDFKAELRDPELAAHMCQTLKAQHIGTIAQTDVYYKLADGRLKRREAKDEPVEWIYYHRPDRVRPKLCNYTIFSEMQARRRWGTQSLKPWVTVKKVRNLWMLENIRIHLDEVEQLGHFLELEAQVSKLHRVQECHLKIGELRQSFTPILGEPISLSYSDLIAQESAETAS